MNLNKIVKATIKSHGENAPTHFGFKKATLDGYMRTGKWPLKLINQILTEQMGAVGAMEAEQPPLAPSEHLFPDAQPAPIGPAFMQESVQPPLPPEPPPTVLELGLVQQRLNEVAKYIQGTIDFYIRQYGSRITMLEKQYQMLSQAAMRSAGLGNVSLARPDTGVPVDQWFTTNPNAGAPLGAGPYAQPRMGNALDTGIAPTREMVEAQANMTTLEGVPVPNAQQAHPAFYDPNAKPFGFGWNVPRPPRR